MVSSVSKRIGGRSPGRPANSWCFASSAPQAARSSWSVPAGVLVFGEVGLAGEIRPVAWGEERLQEAAKLGFTAAIAPQANLPRHPIPGLHAHGVSTLADALAAMRTLAADAAAA